MSGASQRAHSDPPTVLRERDVLNLQHGEPCISSALILSNERFVSLSTLTHLGGGVASVESVEMVHSTQRAAVRMSHDPEQVEVVTQLVRRQQHDP